MDGQDTVVSSSILCNMEWQISSSCFVTSGQSVYDKSSRKVEIIACGIRI